MNESNKKINIIWGPDKSWPVIVQKKTDIIWGPDKGPDEHTISYFHCGHY